MIKKDIGRSNTTISCKSETIGEPIEHKIQRIMNNSEPITDGAPIIYMERKEGVLPQYDIRTDRFDIALDAMDIVAKTKVAQRAERQEKSSEGTELKIQGTSVDKSA